MIRVRLKLLQVRCIPCVPTAVWICPCRRAERTQQHDAHAAFGEESRTRSRRWQSQVSIYQLPEHAIVNFVRPEQLVLQDDPSFLPEFALPPPESLADLDLGFNLELPRSGESQSLTPFGSQPSSQPSNFGGFGLVLPSSSPNQPADFGFGNDNRARRDNSVLNIDNLLQLDDPDFTFGEDGDLIEFTPSHPAPATPAVMRGAPMHSDAGASARVRLEHKEGQQAGAQVGFTPVSHLYQVACQLGQFPNYGNHSHHGCTNVLTGTVRGSLSVTVPSSCFAAICLESLRLSFVLAHASPTFVSPHCY